ncbi:MAG: RNA ligase family protein, partial [Myxococcota bacterium]
ARHSIEYHTLPSYFLAFSIWNEQNLCLSWAETEEWADLLGVTLVPVLYQGPWNESLIRSLSLDTEKQEGFVVRRAAAFAYEDFADCVAKWVRPHHVQTDTHWMHQTVVPNQLANGSL